MRPEESQGLSKSLELGLEPSNDNGVWWLGWQGSSESDQCLVDQQRRFHSFAGDFVRFPPQSGAVHFHPDSSAGLINCCIYGINAAGAVITSI